MRIKIKVTPKSQRNTIKGWHGDRLSIGVTAAPEKDQANESVVRLVASELGCARSRVKIIKGATSREKVIEVPDTLAKHLKDDEKEV